MPHFSLNPEADRRRAHRITTGAQTGVDVPVDLLALLVGGTGTNARKVVRQTLGEKTTAALSALREAA